jgi:hypothetical protein
MGPAGLVQAAAIVGCFSMQDVAANPIGIPLESVFVKDTEDFRAEFGINDYPSARNTLGA